MNIFFNNADKDPINKNYIIHFFDKIISEQNKDKLNRSARKIYIDYNSYSRVTNNIGEYCQVLDSTGSGNSIWYFYHSPKDGIGFIIISSSKNWSWQKMMDNNLIQVL